MNLDKMFDIGIIAQLAYQISTTQKADVFFYYYGHTQSITVIIYAQGWSEAYDEDDYESTTIWLNEGETLKNIINKLEGMLKNGVV